ncbi:MAG: NrfD/PsrC family molybdoenzyme membrane anchor subunit [Anaerolineales bacterium]
MKIKIRIPDWMLSPWVMGMVILSAMAILISFIRMVVGIGPVSNLNDAYPWGFWISFDIYTGVALGAGAFTMAAVVYIFDLKKFTPLVRPSVLTGFLGYAMVAVALLVDLGRPENIWHMIIYQNHTSFLFEIGICVMTYLTVLLLEFIPVIFEGFRWNGVVHFFHKWLTLPLVILGVVLSTLHQSSLGSLTIIMPAKLHPLWWTPFIPILFFVSAVIVGFGMVIVESQISARALHRGIEINLLKVVASWIPYGSALYLILRFGQLAVEGKLGYLFTSGVYSLLFWIEILLIGIIPLVLFSQKKVRKSPNGLLYGALSVVLGVVLNRFDVSWIALGGRIFDTSGYVPSISEVLVSFGFVAASVLVFRYIALHFPLFVDEEEYQEENTIEQAHPVKAGD